MSSSHIASVFCYLNVAFKNIAPIETLTSQPLCSRHSVQPQKNAFPCCRALGPKNLISLNAILQNGPVESNDDVSNQIRNDPSRFYELMSPIQSVQPDQMSASALAYLGDVVFELFIRSRYVWPERRMSQLQNKVVSVVRAETQSMLLKKFVNTFPLTPAEKSVLSRGRNANLSARKKMKGGDSSGGATAFQDSTAFEALIGYSYISNKERFAEMMHAIKIELDKMDTE